MPGPRDAGINRRETVQRHQHRWPAFVQALVDDLVDPPMIGIEDRTAPHLDRLARQSLIAGNGGGFADQRDRACDMRRPVAVDHQPRIALRDQMGVELLRQLLGDAGNADIPRDVPRQLCLGQAEIAEDGRNQPAVMVAGEQERRAACRIKFVHRRHVARR